MQRDEPLGLQHDDRTAGGAKAHRALQHARAYVEHALVGEQLGLRQHERLLVDVQPDDRPVGRADDRLTGRREAERRLTVRNRPCLVEAVDEERRVVRRDALVVRAAHAHVAVGDGEQGLGLAEVVPEEPPGDQAPRIDRRRAIVLAALTHRRQCRQARLSHSHPSSSSGLVRWPPAPRRAMARQGANSTRRRVGFGLTATDPSR